MSDSAKRRRTRKRPERPRDWLEPDDERTRRLHELHVRRLRERREEGAIDLLREIAERFGLDPDRVEELARRAIAATSDAKP